ncbi:MAG TPA: hypothetical protein PK529_11685 [Verrucomicrobiales bacterium]|nr:hypothetical protein [Verrucomicrobiales bacterium]
MKVSSRPSISILLFLTLFVAGLRVVGAQDTPATPGDPYSVFRAGTFVGSGYEQIEASGFFGRRLLPRAQMGKWNVPYKLEFSERFANKNPYITEVGFFENREAAYFLIAKHSMESGMKLNGAEVQSLLYKVARGGAWVAKPASENSDDYNGGEFHEYTHTSSGDSFRLFAFVPQSRRQVLIYSPLVSPNLGGSSAAPGVILKFMDGQEIPLTISEPGDAPTVRLIDAPAPLPDLAAELAGPKADLARASLDTFFQKLSPETKSWELSGGSASLLHDAEAAIAILEAEGSPDLLRHLSFLSSPFEATNRSDPGKSVPPATLLEDMKSLRESILGPALSFEPPGASQAR